VLKKSSVGRLALGSTTTSPSCEERRDRIAHGPRERRILAEPLANSSTTRPDTTTR